MTNHLDNVQATILDRVTAAKEKSPRGTDTLTGYRADISTAQDYYPFGMLMPGRYISDTARHCVTQTSTVMVEKPIRIWVWPPVSVDPVRTWHFGTIWPSVGSLDKAPDFGSEVLHVYHYLDGQSICPMIESVY